MIPTRAPLRPEPLRPDHDVADFDSGRRDGLDAWLHSKALVSEGFSARTYVVADAAAPGTVVAFYSLSAGEVVRSALPSAKVRRNMPDVVPVALLGRLAVHRLWQGKGLGSALVVDAVRKTAAAARILGVRALLVHAIDEKAVAFYARHGFLSCPIGNRTLAMPIEIVRRLAAEEPER